MYSTRSSTQCYVAAWVGGALGREWTRVYVLLTPSLFTRNCHNLVNRLCVCVLVALSRPTLCDPMDCSLPGSFVHGDSPGKNTGVGFHAFLQGIFQTQGVNSGLLHCRQILCRYEPAILQYEIKSLKKKKKKRVSASQSSLGWTVTLAHKRAAPAQKTES